MNASTTTKPGGQPRQNTETQMLGVIGLACCSMAIAAAYVLCHSLLALTSNAAGRQLINLFWPSGF